MINAVSTCTVAVYYTLKYYMHSSPKFQLNYCRAPYFKLLRARQSNYYQKNSTVHYTLKCYVHGSLFFFNRNYCHEPYLNILCVQQPSSRQYFEMPHFWESKFWKKQLPPEFSMETF